MRHRRIGYVAICLLLPAVAIAADPQTIAVDSIATKKFLPIDRDGLANRKAENGVTVIREKNGMMPLSRSDRDSLTRGAMRTDRTSSPLADHLRSPMMVPADDKADKTEKTEKPNENALASRDAPKSDEIAPESDDIEGLKEGNDPVLALFDDSEGAQLLSFADAMKGGGVNGSRRHIMWPLPLGVNQKVTSGYGLRSDPFHGRLAFHGGIDIAAAVGTPVLATADGEVVEVRTDARYGKYIGIKHSDGTISRYGHLSAQDVKEGERVKTGQAVGALGSTGRSTGPHLDYRVSRNGMRFDPLAVLTVPSGVPADVLRQRQPMVADASSAVSVPDVRPVMHPLPRRPLVIKVQ